MVYCISFLRMHTTVSRFLLLQISTMPNIVKTKYYYKVKFLENPLKSTLLIKVQIALMQLRSLQVIILQRKYLRMSLILSYTFFLRITRHTTGARGHKFELFQKYILTISNNFLRLSCSISVYLCLFWTILVYLGASWYIYI